jgi:hypothetical protein
MRSPEEDRSTHGAQASGPVFSFVRRALSWAVRLVKLRFHMSSSPNPPPGTVRPPNENVRRAATELNVLGENELPTAFPTGDAWKTYWRQ